MDAPPELRLLQALHSVLQRPADLVRMIAESADDAAAIAALQVEFNLDSDQAQVIMHNQFRSLTRAAMADRATRLADVQNVRERSGSD